ncbi:hypothetical protein FRC17_002801 [Serendipita sp. 399]|nr:hypothetical protein FRC17_002801 [Serendipita sp. 399]
MATPQQALAGSKLMGGDRVINEFIRTRQEQVKNYEDLIKREEKNLQQSEEAIENLEKALTVARRALEFQRQNLDGLLAIQSRISSVSISLDSPLKGERSSSELCEALKATLVEQTKGGTSILDPLINFSQGKMDEINLSTRRLATELSSWRFAKDLHRKSLKHSRSALKEIINDLKLAKRTSWSIPAEIWIGIFRLRVQEDLDEFYTVQNSRPFQPTVAVFSKVCRLWREIVMQEPDLWRYIAAHPCQQWSNNKLELFKSSLRVAQRRKVYVSNISQTLVWTNGQVYYDSNLHTNQYPTAVNGGGIEGEYDIIIVTGSDHPSHMAKISTFPFQSPEKLTLVNRPGARYGHFFSHIPQYTSVRSLEIVDPIPYHLDNLQLWSRFPNLTQLSLEAEAFTHPFSSRSFLASLEVLRIWHSGRQNLPLVSGTVNLRHLTILDVTPPATSLFQTVNVPALQQLLLHGPSKTATVAPTPPSKPRIRLQSVKYLEFYKWLDPSHILGVADCDAVATLRKWISQMPKVTRLKFVDSHVDGTSLIDLVRSWNNMGTPKVGELTLDRCTGIKRQECEELMELVEKVRVFA